MPPSGKYSKKYPLKTWSVVKDRKISFGEISRKTGISMAHVSKVFNGLRVPSLRTFAILASAKGVSLDDLYMELYGAQERVRGAKEPHPGAAGRSLVDSK